MDLTGHVRCSGCGGVYPRTWEKNPQTGAGITGGGHHCSSKCRGVILIRTNVKPRVRRTVFA